MACTYLWIFINDSLSDMRDIKFRAWNNVHHKMYWFDLMWGNHKQGNGYIGMVEWGEKRGTDRNYNSNQSLIDPTDCDIMQYTGLKDKNGKEIYEGDIRREEVENDEGDEVLYYTLTWIKEWSMFAWLHLPGEYQSYVDNGAEHLETDMYWTYPAGIDEDNKIVICGNIHENPTLLT